LCAAYRAANFTEEDEMQTNETKAATDEKLSLGALMVILVVTNAAVLVNLAPYA
jgi:hypothetical protein